MALGAQPAQLRTTGLVGPLASTYLRPTAGAAGSNTNHSGLQWLGGRAKPCRWQLLSAPVSLASSLPLPTARPNVGRLRQRQGRQQLACTAALGKTPTVSRALARVPMLLTWARVLAIPALIAAWWSPAPWAAAAVTALFVGASLTDFLDGYLARKWNAASSFGAFLDPVADKLMVATVMVLLSSGPVPAGVAAGNTWLMPVSAIVVISREIAMSAIREWAATLGSEARSAAAVSWMGKWKTASQMASLTLYLYARQATDAAQAGLAADLAGVLMLVALSFTVASFADYCRALAKYMD